MPADGLASVLEQKVRERVNNEEVVSILSRRARIAADCGYKTTDDVAACAEKHLPNIYAMGAECVASKTGITDPAEKSSMIATCFWNSTKHHRESSGLTDQELIMYDEVWNCVLAGTGGGKA
ncbi:uncharacterized protein LOC144108236 [Amblyomma americanum]